MSDVELTTAQLESWVENQAKVGIVFENGLSVGLNEPGTLDRWEGLFVFRNSLVAITFTPRNAVAEVRFEDSVYQIRLRYGCGLLSLFEWKEAETFNLGTSTRKGEL